MCEFSHKDSKLVILKKFEALDGFRGFFIKFDDNKIKSLNREFYFTKAITKTKDKPDLDGNLGIYNYNYNYYNYNYSYNYYDNYYNYNNNYSYYNYDYNYYNFFWALTKAYGKTVIHDLGHRSQSIEIKALLSLKDHKNKDLLKHFNSQIERIAKLFKVKVIPYQSDEPMVKL